MESQEYIQFLFNRVDFILWKFWDPIGGGQINLPRDEYSSYSSPITNAVLEGKSQIDISKMLYRYESQNMGLNGNYEHDTHITDMLLNIPKTGRLLPLNIAFYIEQHEEQFHDIFISNGFPTAYYFFEMIDMIHNLKAIHRKNILSLDLYRNKWKVLITAGHPWINVAPVGYWEKAFVFCIEYKKENENSVPVGLTSVMTPGLPFAEDEKLRINISENVEILE